MMIHEITPLAGKYKSRKRIGRGQGSGNGKQAGRGHKGAGSRAGYSRRFAFEGGQMPYFRRMPKLGFSNTNFRTLFWTVNLGDLLKHPSFANGGTITAETLIEAGLVRDTSRPVKILGGLPEGVTSLSVKLEINTARVTDAARKLVTDAGGSVTEIGTRKDRVRGIDRNSDDRSPTKQTKKADRRDFLAERREAAKKGEFLKREAKASKKAKNS